MSNLLSSVILGAVQGITEFLPVSSSGHLIITRDLLHLTTSSDFLFDVILHLATALAVVVYFRTDLWRIISSLFRGIVLERDRILVMAIIIGTIPVFIAGLLFKSSIETIFRSDFVVVGGLIVGSIIFWYAEKQAKVDAELSVKSGFKIGLFQVLSLVPGMSRSGMTISGGLFSGLSRERAAVFSFLLGLPAIFGAGVLSLVDARDVISANGLGLDVLFGGAVAFIFGMLAIHVLLKYLRTHSLQPFIWYRFALAFVLLVFLLWR